MASRDYTLLSKLGFSDPDKCNPIHNLICQYLSNRDVSEKVCRNVINILGFSHKESNISNTNTYKKEFLSALTQNWKIKESEIEWITRCCNKKTYNIKYNIIDNIKIEKDISYGPCDVKCSREVVLSKGTGDYRTTIGFLDIVFGCNFTYTVILNHNFMIDECFLDVGYSSERLTQRIKEIPDIILASDQCKNINGCILPSKREEDLESFSFTIIVEVKAGQVGIEDLLRQINLYREYCNNRSLFAVVTPVLFSELDIQSMKDENICYIHLGVPFQKWLSEQSQSYSQCSHCNGTGIVELTPKFDTEGIQ